MLTRRQFLQRALLAATVSAIPLRIAFAEIEKQAQGTIVENDFLWEFPLQFPARFATQEEIDALLASAKPNKIYLPIATNNG